MEHETFSDCLDELWDTFYEALEEAKRYEDADDFKMHIYNKMKEVARDMPKVCVELALKELTKI